MCTGNFVTNEIIDNCLWHCNHCTVIICRAANLTVVLCVNTTSLVIKFKIFIEQKLYSSSCKLILAYILAFYQKTFLELYVTFTVYSSPLVVKTACYFSFTCGPLCAVCFLQYNSCTDDVYSRCSAVMVNCKLCNLT